MNQQALVATLNELFGNSNLDEITVEQTEELADKYPYFPVAQYLQAKKMKAEGLEGAEKQAQKAALFFTNPFWFNYQMAGDQISESVIAETEDDPLVQQETIEDHPITTIFTQEEIEYADQKAHEELGNDEAENSILSENDHPITTEFTLAEIEAASELAHKDLGTGEEVSALPVENAEVNDTAISSEEIEIAGKMENADLNQSEISTEEIEDDAEMSDDEAEQNLPHDEHEQMFRNIKAMLESSIDDESSAFGKNGISIDPYHTIDYFASQGIKLELEPDPQDKLGIQLKKFTQWLKHMKKLGPEDALENIEQKEPDMEVQQKAEISNVTKEVVTEAMAQVLEKQGKNEKAIQLYIKLSFLNPDKSIYFADKIKNLKGI